MASLSPALESGDTQQSCVVGSRDFEPEVLDDRNFFRNRNVEAMRVEGWSVARLIHEIGEPQWTNKGGPNSFSMKWVHGARNSAIDYLCDGTSQLTYLTSFLVLNIETNDGSIESCKVYEDTYITRKKIEWSSMLKPLFRDEYECEKYFNVLNLPYK